ncbi:hypothetical protein ACFPM7_14750 [Actinokineospora guangxiensis]|uniref:IrrE N-terminal-like domain-containing protein n=1 Tax=Actinokineospora guangxiensis TaxID=1490288 RepID=A0ABW0ELM9_9PSEU
MVTRRAYRKWRALVEDLPLPEPFTVPDLVAAVAARRGRPIDIGTLPGGASAQTCGVWFQLVDRDVILVEENTSSFHRDHIVLHELGHMLCDHRGGADEQGRGDGIAALARLLPDLSPDLVRRMLNRTAYTTDEEQEAELVASLIRITAEARAQRATPGVLGNLAAALGLDRAAR